MSGDTGTGGATAAPPRDSDTFAAPAQREELARFLRAMRERASPEDFGVTVSSRRRAPGLLREEVARFAGVSTTWITWLEQARPIRPSVDALVGLAEALRLDAVEREHLFRLAGLSDPAPYPPDGERAGALATALVSGLFPHPAYAFDRLWNVVAHNDAAAALLGPFIPGDFAKGNLLARIFLDAEWRRLFVDWPEVAKAAAAQFRAATADIAAARQTRSLVSRLSAECPAFAAVWEKARLQHPPNWRKALNHPEGGTLSFRYSIMRPEGDARALRVSIYLPEDTRTRDAVAALSG